MLNFKVTGNVLLASMLACGSMQAGIIDALINPFTKSAEPADANVGILIAHDVPGIVLEVKGKYRIYDPLTQDFISTRFIGKRKFVQAYSDGIKWGEEFPSVHQIQIVPEDPKTSTLVDGIEYSGVVTVYDIGGTISVVNDIPSNEYLKAILNPNYFEMPEELAAAYVIAERTNTLYQLKNPPSRYFTVDKDNVNYKGKAAAIHGDGFTPAIQATRDMVMTKNRAPFAVNLYTNKADPSARPALGNLSFDQALALANQGNHAAQILNKAFPGSTLSLIGAL
jgi:hypothetical protein